MEHTIQRLAKVLGAVGIETAGHDTRFFVVGGHGGHLQVSIEAATQRVMAVLKDASSIVRCTLHVAPIPHLTADPPFPGRVTPPPGRLPPPPRRAPPPPP